MVQTDVFSLNADQDCKCLTAVLGNASFIVKNF